MLDVLEKSNPSHSTVVDEEYEFGKWFYHGAVEGSCVDEALSNYKSIIISTKFAIALKGLPFD